MKNIEIYAAANVLTGGKAFSVVHKPDWNGGHYYEIEPSDYETGDYEYIEWSGTPAQFAEQNPTFWAHSEPFHGEPQDYAYSAMELLRAHLRRQ